VQLIESPERVAVLGVGYVGLTAAACLAHLGHDVVAIDIDAERVAGLQQGVVPIHEADLPELVASGLASGRLQFTTEAGAALSGTRFVFVCVPTPPRADGHADLHFLDSAVDGIASLLDAECVLVLKSTVPVGTNQRVVERLGRPDVKVVSNPEFLREGLAVRDFLDADRVVVGASAREAGDAVAALYGTTPRAVLHTDPATAELVKYATNAFLASRLSFVNELAAICELVGGTIDDVVTGLGLDHRIGANHLSPGPGWGGSCFPKDIRSLQATASDVGIMARMLDSVVAANDDQFDRLADKVEAIAGGSLNGKRVAVLGLTFKAGTDDLRDSPALAVVGRLLTRGAAVTAYDPMVDAPPIEGMTIAASALDAAASADVVAFLTEWDELGSLDLGRLAAVMAGDGVVDGRNMLDPHGVRLAGLRYMGIGRGAA